MLEKEKVIQKKKQGSSEVGGEGAVAEVQREGAATRKGNSGSMGAWRRSSSSVVAGFSTSKEEEQSSTKEKQQ